MTIKAENEIYYHYKGFEFRITKCTLTCDTKKFYSVVGHDLPHVYGNDKEKMLEKIKKLIDKWHKNKENVIKVTEDYTNYKNNAETYSNYKYLNTGIHIVTSHEMCNENLTIEKYLSNPKAYTQYTSDNISMEVLALV